MPTNDASLRRIQNRKAAFILHSRYDSRELTKKAREEFDRSFLIKVDPEGVLDSDERQRRADAARRAHFVAMAEKSVAARRRRKGGRHDS